MIDEKQIEELSLKLSDLVEAKLKEKMEELVKSGAYKVNNKDLKNIPPETETTDKSVMNSDPLTRKLKPFLKLSDKMEQFAKDFKYFAKTGIVPSHVKALNEGTPEAGGFLVPEEFQAEVIRYVTETAIVRPRARVYNMTREVMKIPRLAQVEKGHFGGVALYWIGESELKTESQPEFRNVVLTARKLIGLCPVTDELLEDSAINLTNFLVSLFGEAIAYEEDNQFINGDGISKPLGIIPGSTNTVNRQVANKITYEDLKHMMTALPAWADKGAIWLLSKGALEQLLDIKSGVFDGTKIDETKGMPLLLPGFNLANGLPPTILGYNYVLTDKVPAVGNKGDIVLANFGYYYIGDRSDLAVASSIHERFRYDETTFRFVKRVDGQPAVSNAFVVLDVPAGP